MLERPGYWLTGMRVPHSGCVIPRCGHGIATIRTESCGMQASFVCELTTCGRTRADIIYARRDDPLSVWTELGVAGAVAVQVCGDGSARAYIPETSGCVSRGRKQALAVGVISLAPGAVVGIAVAYLLNQGSNATSGGNVDFRVDPALVVGSFVVALAIAVLAAYLPARRAARLRIVEALQYE